ncbi:MAG: hypothetical protein IPG17_05020 [Sandaracinaceae bacterium]|jgi:hypothetical protein|nr:hypothetical protein [Sandaracinaceae bacterium]MBK6807519.1 hypothetical protein [Sandaracinaceae bacterium]MBK7152327.1 hypothetical protein [Sandaracinaceae bacterium]MBK7774536.1 hypothetical protein [Sandaracinaceae bacterium]MBK8410741.1 hypothetical protein [Sandaracinaceae bacterium]
MARVDGRGVVAATLLVVCVLGCAGRIASYNRQGAETVRTRAAFDFACNEEQVSVVPVTTGSSTTGSERYHRDLVIEYGAAGCGKRAVFVRLDNGQWLRNGEVSVD